MSPKKFSKKILTLLIIVGIIVLILLGFGLSQILKDANKENSNQGSNAMSNYTPSHHEYVFPSNTNNSAQNSETRTQTPSPSVTPLVTVEILQNILKKSPEMSKLPSDAKLVLEFDDNNKQYTGYIFFIGEKGQVSAYTKQPYDFWLAMNINKLSVLENSMNICSDLKNLIKTGDASVIYSPNNPLVLMKYMPIKSCVM